jgi:Ribose/xylose/arabinose/galactoside ABC-type transport systems, permease components
LSGDNVLKTGLKKIVGRQDFSVILIFAIMFILAASLENNFFSSAAIVRNINAFSPLILMAMGQAIVLIAGGVDLSCGALLSLQTCILTYVMKTNDPITGVYAIVITFIVSIGVGVLNGVGVGVFRIPAIVVTFATSFMCLGIALFIRPTPGGQATNWFQAFYNVSLVNGAPEGLVAMGKIIPPALLLVLGACAIWFVISKTKTGRYIYAVGSNRDNAYASGINTAGIQIKAYVINAIFIMFAAMYFAAQNQSGDARMGDPMTLRAIAAAVVGGVALTGGRGNVYFAILGALTLSFVNKVIYFANVPTAYQTLAGGLIIILAISTSTIYTFTGKKTSLKVGD